MELQQFGWNAVTIGFIGTFLFNFVRVWGLGHQVARVWRQRSGQSLSVPAFCYQLGASGAVLTYGLFLHSLALIINGVLSLVLLLPLVIGLGKFKGIDRASAALLVTMVGVTLAMIFLPHKDWFFFASALGMIAASWLVPWEIWRNRHAGVVEVRMVLANLVNSTFWLIYAIAIGDWVLMFLNPNFLASGLVTLALWLRYRPRRRSV